MSINKRLRFARLVSPNGCTNKYFQPLTFGGAYRRCPKASKVLRRLRA